MRKLFFRGTLLAILAILVLSLASCKSLHKHNYGDWIYSTEPTCSQTGEKYRKCKCGECETVTVAPLGVHKLEDNVCTMCKKNLNPYFFNLFKSLICEDYPLVIKELSLTVKDKTKNYSFKNTELIISADNSYAQLVGTCAITENNATTDYSFVAMLDDDVMYTKLTSVKDELSTPYYVNLPLSAVQINSDFSTLEEELRKNALFKHSSTLALLVNSAKEWRKTAVPAIISFCESHFEDIAPLLNDYFTSLFKVSMIDDKVKLELNFSKIKEFNNSLYNEKISALYEKTAKEPYNKVEGKITDILNTTVGELLSAAEEENLDLNKAIQYCFTALYNLRVINSSKIPESIAEKLSDEYSSRTLLSLIAEDAKEDDRTILDEVKSAISKIGELTGYQYVYKLAEGKNYDQPTAEENVALRDRWNSINSHLISFASFATTAFVTDSDGRLCTFKITMRTNRITINVRLDKEYEKTEIPSATLDEIKSVSATLTREELISLSSSLEGASVNNNILSFIRQNVNEDLQITHYIEEFNISECIVIYSPISDNIIRIALLGALYELDENGERLDMGMSLTSLTLLYCKNTGTIAQENSGNSGTK